MHPKLKRTPFLFFLLLSCSMVFAQQRTITGNISDRDTREPLAGATVSIKGTDRVVVTDTKGDFSIPASEESVLKITMVGYEYQEIPVGKLSNISVRLSVDNKKMDEVVVVG